MHNDKYVVTAGMRIGPSTEVVSRKRQGDRGKDRVKCAARTCPRCKFRNPEWKNKCKGRAWADICDYFDGKGKRRCGRCYKSNGVRAYECLETRGKIEDCEYFDEKGFPKK